MMHVIKAQGPEHIFDRALRSYQTGGITLDDLLGQIDDLLASGTSSGELLELLWRREQVEPLAVDVYSAVHAQIMARMTAAAADSPPESSMPVEAATIVLGEEGADRLAALPDTLSDAHFGDRFRLLETIGDGAMSRVYKAEDVTAAAGGRRLLAIKVFKHALGDGSLAMDAVEAEFMRLRALSHPNIAQLFECGRVGNSLYITMEYVAGETLYGRLHPASQAHSRPLPADQVNDIVAGIAQALESAHAHQIVHGDLKPGNVLLTDAGVKVIDFGLTSRPGTVALTPRYASPQLLAQQTPRPADDVYALACVAYEALSGRHPFAGADRLDSARTPPPRQPEFSSAQYAALLRGLSAERADRTQTAHEFLREFSQAEPAAVAARAAVGGAGRGRIVWIALLMLAVGGFGAWMLYSKRGQLPTARIAPPESVAPAVPTPDAAPVPAAPAESTAAAPAAGASVQQPLRDCAACPFMTVIPAGRFRQGVPDEDRAGLAAERPQHLVVFAHPLAVAVSDVTVGQYAAFAAATHREVNGCDVYDGDWRHRNSASYKDPGYPQSDMHPVTCVSFNDAIAYTKWLSRQSGRAYRLPSAAEWEYAARGGGSASMPWDAGGANACASANVADETAGQQYPGWSTFGCRDGFVYTSPVGSFPANGFGLRDMLGNLLQWTQDCWHSSYTGASAEGAARVDGDCREHELRGGSWFSAPPVVRTSHRNHFAAGYRTSSVGFRVVRDVQP